MEDFSKMSLKEVIQCIHKMYSEYDYLTKDEEDSSGYVEFLKRRQALLVAEQYLTNMKVI